MVLQPTRDTSKSSADATSRILDAASQLFYERGINAVGMDAIRDASGVSLKRLYQLFASKDELVVAVLRRLDQLGHASLAAATAAPADPDERILALFDWLDDWFREPGFRGCAFFNAFAERGGTSADVAHVVADQKRRLRNDLAGLVAAAQRSPALVDQLALLANGAMVTAGVLRSAEPAIHARAAARALLDGSPRRPEHADAE